MKIANVKEFFAISEHDTEKEQDVKRFFKIFESQWAVRVELTATAVATKKQFNRKQELPEPEDVEKLTKYVKNQLHQQRVNPVHPSWFQYKAAVELVQVRLATYNKRRPGEIEGIL